MALRNGYPGWTRGHPKSLLRLVFLGLLASVLASMVTPDQDLQLLINRLDFIRGIAKFFRSAAPGFQIHHLLSFAAVGFVAHVGWPGWRAWHVALVLCVVAGFAELAQLWVPGRMASVWHVLLDVAGGVMGFFMAWLVNYAWGDDSFPEPAAPPLHPHQP